MADQKKKTDTDVNNAADSAMSAVPVVIEVKTASAGQTSAAGSAGQGKMVVGGTGTSDKGSCLSNIKIENKENVLTEEELTEEDKEKIKELEEKIDAVDWKKNIDPKLMEELKELKKRGCKCTLENVIQIYKNADGELMWFEKGNYKSGYIHICFRHEKDLAAKGISAEDIPDFLGKILSTKPVEKGVDDEGRPYAKYECDGNEYKVGYGTNGFIVTLFPCK